MQCALQSDIIYFSTFATLVTALRVTECLVFSLNKLGIYCSIFHNIFFVLVYYVSDHFPGLNPYKPGVLFMGPRQNAASYPGIFFLLT